jgi:hypothetical protein
MIANATNVVRNNPLRFEVRRIGMISVAMLNARYPPFGEPRTASLAGSGPQGGFLAR